MDTFYTYIVLVFLISIRLSFQSENPLKQNESEPVELLDKKSNKSMKNTPDLIILPIVPNSGNGSQPQIFVDSLKSLDEFSKEEASTESMNMNALKSSEGNPDVNPNSEEIIHKLNSTVDSSENKIMQTNIKSDSESSRSDSFEVNTSQEKSASYKQQIFVENPHANQNDKFNHNSPEQYIQSNVMFKDEHFHSHEEFPNSMLQPQKYTNLNSPSKHFETQEQHQNPVYQSLTGPSDSAKQFHINPNPNLAITSNSPEKHLNSYQPQQLNSVHPPDRITKDIFFQILPNDKPIRYIESKEPYRYPIPSQNLQQKPTFPTGQSNVVFPNPASNKIQNLNSANSQPHIYPDLGQNLPNKPNFPTEDPNILYLRPPLNPGAEEPRWKKSKSGKRGNVAGNFRQQTIKFNENLSPTATFQNQPVNSGDFHPQPPSAISMSGKFKITPRFRLKNSTPYISFPDNSHQGTVTPPPLIFNYNGNTNTNTNIQQGTPAPRQILSLDTNQGGTLSPPKSQFPLRYDVNQQGTGTQTHPPPLPFKYNINKQRTPNVATLVSQHTIQGGTIAPSQFPFRFNGQTGKTAPIFRQGFQYLDSTVAPPVQFNYNNQDGSPAPMILRFQQGQVAPAPITVFHKSAGERSLQQHSPGSQSSIPIQNQNYPVEQSEQLPSPQLLQQQPLINQRPISNNVSPSSFQFPNQNLNQNFVQGTRPNVEQFTYPGTAAPFQQTNFQQFQQQSQFQSNPQSAGIQPRSRFSTTIQPEKRNFSPMSEIPVQLRNPISTMQQYHSGNFYQQSQPYQQPLPLPFPQQNIHNGNSISPQYFPSFPQQYQSNFPTVNYQTSGISSPGPNSWHQPYNNNAGNNFQNQIPLPSVKPQKSPSATQSTTEKPKPYKLEIEIPPFIPASLDGYIPSKPGTNYTMPDLTTEVITYPIEVKESMVHHQYHPKRANEDQNQNYGGGQTIMQSYNSNQYPLILDVELEPKHHTKREPKEYTKQPSDFPEGEMDNTTSEENGNENGIGEATSDTFQVLSRMLGFTSTTTTPAPQISPVFLRPQDLVDIREIFFTTETPRSMKLSSSKPRCAKSTKSNTTKKSKKQKSTRTKLIAESEEGQLQESKFDQQESSLEGEDKSDEAKTDAPEDIMGKKKPTMSTTEMQIVTEAEEENTTEEKESEIPCKKDKVSEEKNKNMNIIPQGTPEVQVRILWNNKDQEEISGDTSQSEPFKTITPIQVLQNSWPQTGNTMKPQEGLVSNNWPYNEQAQKHEIPFHSESQGRPLESVVRTHQYLYQLNQLNQILAKATIPPPSKITTSEPPVEGLAKSAGRFAGGVVRNVSALMTFMGNVGK